MRKLVHIPAGSACWSGCKDLGSELPLLTTHDTVRGSSPAHCARLVTCARQSRGLDRVWQPDSCSNGLGAPVCTAGSRWQVCGFQHAPCLLVWSLAKKPARLQRPACTHRPVRHIARLLPACQASSCRAGEELIGAWGTCRQPVLAAKWGLPWGMCRGHAEQRRRLGGRPRTPPAPLAPRSRPWGGAHCTRCPVRSTS